MLFLFKVIHICIFLSFISTDMGSLIQTLICLYIINKTEHVLNSKPRANISISTITCSVCESCLGAARHPVNNNIILTLQPLQLTAALG